MKLKPCPFCGNEKLTLNSYSYGKGRYSLKIECKTCYSSGPCCFDFKEAEARWNLRHEPV